MKTFVVIVKQDKVPVCKCMWGFLANPPQLLLLLLLLLGLDELLACTKHVKSLLSTESSLTVKSKSPRLLQTHL